MKGLAGRLRRATIEEMPKRNVERMLFMHMLPRDRLRTEPDHQHAVVGTTPDYPRRESGKLRDNQVLDALQVPCCFGSVQGGIQSTKRSESTSDGLNVAARYVMGNETIRRR